MRKLSDSAKVYIRSTTIVLGISFLGAFAFYLLGQSFLPIFILFLISQYILFTFIGGIIRTHIAEDRKKKELDKLESLSTILQCAYCRKPNLMTFDPNETERIEFSCDHCKNRNLVNLQFVVAQVSQPLEIPKVIGIPSEFAKNP